MELSGIILKIANGAVSFVVIAFLCLAGAYSGYALWDNNQVYAAAENVQQDMINLRPDINEEEDSGASFEELLEINPDVCAWVVLDNTGINYPVLQGSTNLTYINTDVYGNFALAGSIYLDSRNDRAFGDAYSLLYGHHMEGGRMFGDLDLYKDREFFENNHTGMLILPDRTYDLEVYACVVIPASDKMIFNPATGRADLGGLLDYAAKKALFVNKDAAALLSSTSGAKVLAFSTCSSEFTDARTILITVMVPRTSADTAK